MRIQDFGPEVQFPLSICPPTPLCCSLKAQLQSICSWVPLYPNMLKSKLVFVRRMLKTTIQSLLCYSTCLIQNSPQSKDFTWFCSDKAGPTRTITEGSCHAQCTPKRIGIPIVDVSESPFLSCADTGQGLFHFLCIKTKLVCLRLCSNLFQEKFPKKLLWYSGVPRYVRRGTMQ